MPLLRQVVTVLLVSLVVACGRTDDPASTDVAPPLSAAVTAQRLLAADDEPGQWLSHGRTYGEQRFSPLTELTPANVGELGLAWYGDLRMSRAQESTPLFVDGVLYVTTAWSNVQAYDARTGTLLWNFDAQVDREWGSRACCDVVNRGAAAWNGKVYVGTIDGRLLAIDAATGTLAWETDTLVRRDVAYTITGAPRIVKGKVIIGNGGAEYGVRGYITAYDAQTRSQVQTPQNNAVLGSLQNTFDTEADGSIDLYFGPAAPPGGEKQWIRTATGTGFFLYFRIYGPEAAALDGTWKLSDVTRS